MDFTGYLGCGAAISTIVSDTGFDKSLSKKRSFATASAEDMSGSDSEALDTRPVRGRQQGERAAGEMQLDPALIATSLAQQQHQAQNHGESSLKAERREQLMREAASIREALRAKEEELAELQ